MLLFEDSTLKNLTKGSSRSDLDALKDGVLVVASNMQNDNKISNGEYDDICGALNTIREVLDKAESRKKEESVTARQTELPDEVLIDSNSIDLFVGSLVARNQEAKTSLSHGFGNRDYTIKGIENRTKIIKAINTALKLDMKFKLVFYSDEIAKD